MIGDLFERIPTNNVLKNGEGDLPATTAIVSNNQIGRYIDRKNATILKNVFSATANGFGKAFYQPNEFTVLQDSYAFKLKEEYDYIDITKVHSFFVASLNKVYAKYDWSYKSGWNKIKKEYIYLPVKKGDIDYKFMIDLISELEEERISELKKYLKVTGLDSYALNLEEEKAVADFKNLNWGEFNYTELFELLKTKNKLNKMQLDENGKYDVYSAISSNNGIMGKTLVEPEYIVNKVIPYYICFGDHTRKFSIAKSSFSVMDNVKVLKTIETTELKSILFIITTWQKCIKDLGYSRHWKLAKNTKILLPIDSNGNIDYEYMNILISAIQKEVIKGVVDYADKNIDAMKKVVKK